MDFKDKKFLTGLGLGACVFSIIFLFVIHVMRLQHRVDLLESRYTSNFYELQNVINTRSLFVTNEADLISGMYQGVLDATGDKYARYVPVDQVERFNERLIGEFGGIGIIFEIDSYESYPVVRDVIEGGPADRVGMVEGEFIVKINGVDTYAKPSDEIVDLVRGLEGDMVYLELFKDDKVREVQVTREVIHIPSVKGLILEDRIGLLRLEEFIGSSTEELYETYLKLESQKELDGLILDLTYNGGGTLDAVARIAALFLPEGNILMKVKGRDGTDVHLIPPSEDKIELPLVVIVNQYSASASEVLAGALRDYGRADLVGTTTYGKGSVQTTYKLSDGSQALVTTAEFYSPNGGEINGVGLTPENYVEQPEDMIQAALDILLGRLLED